MIIQENIYFFRTRFLMFIDVLIEVTVHSHAKHKVISKPSKKRDDNASRWSANISCLSKLHEPRSI